MRLLRFELWVALLLGLVVGSCEPDEGDCYERRAKVAPPLMGGDSSMKEEYGFGIEDSYVLIEGTWTGTRFYEESEVPVTLIISRKLDDFVTWTDMKGDPDHCVLEFATFPVEATYIEDSVEFTTERGALQRTQITGPRIDEIYLNFPAFQYLWEGRFEEGQDGTELWFFLHQSSQIILTRDQ